MPVRKNHRKPWDEKSKQRLLDMVKNWNDLVVGEYRLGLLNEKFKRKLKKESWEKLIRKLRKENKKKTKKGYKKVNPMDSIKKSKFLSKGEKKMMTDAVKKRTKSRRQWTQEEKEKLVEDTGLWPTTIAWFTSAQSTLNGNFGRRISPRGWLRLVRKFRKEMLEQEKFFVCSRCGKYTHAKDGAADDLPDACSDCWVKYQMQKDQFKEQEAKAKELGKKKNQWIGKLARLKPGHVGVYLGINKTERIKILGFDVHNRALVEVFERDDSEMTIPNDDLFEYFELVKMVEPLQVFTESLMGKWVECIDASGNASAHLVEGEEYEVLGGRHYTKPELDDQLNVKCGSNTLWVIGRFAAPESEAVTQKTWDLRNLKLQSKVEELEVDLDNAKYAFKEKQNEYDILYKNFEALQNELTEERRRLQILSSKRFLHLVMNTNPKAIESLQFIIDRIGSFSDDSVWREFGAPLDFKTK